MNSPAPTHYSMITDTQSPNQLQVMSSPNVIQATPQQHQTTEDFGILLRQLTSIAVSPEVLRDLTRAQELQQVVQAMLQKHSVHESLFVATDEQIRALHRRHDSIMSMLQQFEHQQDGRWKTYASHDELQQASIRETASQAQDIVDQVQRMMRELDSAKHTLSLLQEAVGALQADVTACDAKLEGIRGRNAATPLSTEPEQDASAGDPEHEHRDKGALQRGMEILVKQMLNEQSQREALDFKLTEEASARRSLERRLEALEDRLQASSFFARRPQIFQMSPDPSGQVVQNDGYEDPWWSLGSGPPELGEHPPPIPEELRQSSEQSRQDDEPSHSWDVPGHGAPIGQVQSVAVGCEVIQTTEAREIEATLDACVTPRPGSGHAVSENASSSKGGVPEGRWKLLKDVPALQIAKGTTPWEAGMTFHSWRAQMRTICRGVSQEFGMFADGCWDRAQVLYDEQLASRVKAKAPSVKRCDIEWDGRLTNMLLRTIPEELKQPVIEEAGGYSITAVALCLAVLTRLQPGGSEEITSLQKFLRYPTIANNFQEMAKVLRRYQLALARSRQLKLPELAPPEGLRAALAIARNMERRNGSLQMRLSILRLDPATSTRPTARGVSQVLEMLERECMDLAADEQMKGSSAVDSMVATAAADATKRRKCWFL